MCGRTVGRLRVVAERETTNLCVPSSSSSFSASYSTSSSSSSRYSSSLSLRLLRVSTGCFSLPLFLPTTPFTFLPPSLSPSCTLRLPSPAIHPLRSPFLLPFAVRSLARSFTPFAAPPLLSASSPSPSSPPPVSPVVSLCLSSLFVSLFHPFPPRPFVVPSSFDVPLLPPVGFFLSSFRFRRAPHSLSLSFSVSPFLLPCRSRPFLSSSSPRTLHLRHPLRRYSELSFSFLSHSLSASPFRPLRRSRLSLFPPLSLRELTLWASFSTPLPPPTAVENSSKNIHSTACNTSMADGSGKKEGRRREIGRAHV